VSEVKHRQGRPAAECPGFRGNAGERVEPSGFQRFNLILEMIQKASHVYPMS